MQTNHPNRRYEVVSKQIPVGAVCDITERAVDVSVEPTPDPGTVSVTYLAPLTPIPVDAESNDEETRYLY